MQRHLSWNNCLNVRDLGGLQTRSGNQTNWKSLVRADSLDRLTPDGFRELQQHGITTIIDLRDEQEVARDRLPPPIGVARMHLPLEDQNDHEFWNEWQRYNCTPLYYNAFLARSPDRVAAVFSAIADAPDGGIVFHCGSGRDRTGLITILLLELAQVLPEDIAADYELSAPNLKPLHRIEEEQCIADALAKHQTTVGELVHALLTNFSVEDYLLQAGISTTQISRIRDKLIDL
jgi:protein tyrosine/serine phosphatase